MHQRNFLIIGRMALSTSTCRLIDCVVCRLTVKSLQLPPCMHIFWLLYYLYFLKVEGMSRIADMLENLWLFVGSCDISLVFFKTIAYFFASFSYITTTAVFTINFIYSIIFLCCFSGVFKMACTQTNGMHTNKCTLPTVQTNARTKYMFKRSSRTVVSILIMPS